ncbi:MAG TPA: CoA pyrophosphatase [Chloroflexota bacterium]|nr:CoA pyrophosphatase [Chloroflexota bacterium]
MTTLRSTLALVDSAVLAPIYRGADGRLRLVFIRRSPFGRHGGQIAFPGGRREPEDADLLTTALREAEEEVGLERTGIEVLAALPIIETVATGFRVAPFLGRLKGPPPAWRRQEREVDEIIEVPLDELTHPTAHAVEHWQLPGWPEPREIPFYWIGSYKLWGATYKIVEPLLPRLIAGEWPL